jgi:hypothetical protein
MKGLVGKWVVVIAVGVLGFGFGLRGAFADIVPGNGKADSNCYADLDIDGTDGASIDYEKKSTVYSCVDGSACDLDGACNGECKFHFGVCINVPGVEGCTPPGMLQSMKAKGNVTGVKGASGKVVIDASQLLEGSVCGAYVDAIVPLKGKASKPKAGKAKVKLKAKAPKGTKPRKDSDKYDLVCEPAPGGCGSSSGAFVD